MAADYSLQLEQYRQDHNICAYLNITVTSKADDNHLADKFSALSDETAFSASPAILQFLFPSILRQLLVAECAYHYYLDKINSDAYYQSTLIYYATKGFVSPIWPWIVLPASLSLLAILFNLSLILVTARKVSLSKICNWLIAYESLCQIPAVLPFLVNLVGVIANVDPIDYRLCLATLMLSTAASYASFLALYFMSLERLLIVLFPMEMNCFSESTIKIYSLAAFGICTIFGIAMTLMAFNVWTIINLPFNKWLYCNTGLYSDVMNTIPCYAVISLAILNYALICFYILWRRYCEYKKKDQTVSDTGKPEIGAILSDVTTRRMLRSMLSITSVLFIGWIVGSAARNQITTFIRNTLNAAIPLLVQDDLKAAMLNNNLFSWLICLVTCLFVIASGINAPILVVSNFEYRNAYKRTFRRILTGKKSTIGPLFTNKQ